MSQLRQAPVSKMMDQALKNYSSVDADIMDIHNKIDVSVMNLHS